MSAAVLSPKGLTAEQLALAALSQIPGMSSKTLRLLLALVETPTQLAHANEAQLNQYFEQLRAGKRTSELQVQAQAQIIQGILDGQAENGMERLAEQLAAANVSLIGWGDVTYPPILAQIYDPPLILYVKGKLQALTGKTLGFVGTRHASDYGQRATEHLIGRLAPSGVTVVSGLAQGIDGAAHAAALRHGLPTVAVFGTGLDKVFPVIHKQLAADIIAQGGALVSEYPMGMPGSKHSFPRRNRIIAGLSHGVVVVEGGQKSGSLITARLALEENRSVFAVPGNLFNPGSAGPHYLLKNGAVLTTGADDILSDLHWLPAEKLPEPDGQQLTMLGATMNEDPLLTLIPFDPTPIDLVAHRAGLSMEQLSSQLTLLELHGQIALLPGAKVCRR